MSVEGWNWSKHSLGFLAPALKKTLVTAPHQTGANPKAEAPGSWAELSLWCRSMVLPALYHEWLSRTIRDTFRPGVVHIRLQGENKASLAPGGTKQIGTTMMSLLWEGERDRMPQVLCIEAYLKEQRKWRAGWSGQLDWCPESRWCLGLGCCWDPCLSSCYDSAMVLVHVCGSWYHQRLRG